MDLNKICIKPKKRSSWQAIDLGFKLAIEWFKPLFLLYCIPFYIFTVAVGLLLSEHLGWALLLIWWMKPIFERAPLYFASQALFGEKPPIKVIFKRWLKISKLSWFPAITWRRFSYSRSFDLPINILERLTRTQRTKRINILHNQGSGEALALSVLCFFSSISLFFAFFSLIHLLLPEPIENSLGDWYESETFQVDYLSYIVFAAIIPIAELFFICSGFLLYINRRVHLEAWDIEINFRNMLSKEKYINVNTLKIVPVITGLLFVCSLSTPTTVNALEEIDSIDNAIKTQASSSNKETSKDRISEIFETEDFSQKKEETKWRLKEFDFDDVEFNFLEELLNAISKWLEELVEGWDTTPTEEKSVFKEFLDNLSVVVKALLILAIITVIITIIYRYKQNFTYLINSRKRKSKKKLDEPITTLFGLEITEESLPENIPQEVLHLYKLKKQRSAISLLYRACLSKLMSEKDVIFSESHTEGECLKLVQSKNDNNLSQYIGDVTHLWINLAYGHILPSENEVETVCERWFGVFHHES